MEEILEQQLSEVEQDHRLKVWDRVEWCGWDRVEGCGWDSDVWRDVGGIVIGGGGGGGVWVGY